MSKLIKKVRYYLRPLRSIYELAVGYVTLWRHNYLKNKPLDSINKHGLPGELIISLTSFNKRFGTLQPTLECLLRQTVKADKIILWVSEADYAKIPQGILDLCHHGLTIGKTEDCRSYTKIIPTLEAYPDAFIITVDDDLYYRPTLIEELVNAWDGDKKHIIAHKVRRIRYDNSKVLPYNHWQWHVKGPDSCDMFFPLGYGGVLYPPNALDCPETLDKSLFRKLAPYADDVWLFFMGKRAGARYSVTSDNSNHIVWPGSQKISLTSENSGQSLNDVQIKDMMEQFPDVL